MKRVAITGMGVVSPIGNDVEMFSRNLFAGASGIGLITRFDTTDFKVKVAAEVKDFALEQFGFEKGDARRMDLFTQYAMAAAEQAMLDSGIAGNVDPERLGTYVGSGIGGMQTFINEEEKLLSRGPNRVSPLFIPMMIGNIAAGNIAIRHNAQGPSLPIVTACATSTNTIGEAFRAIRHGYADAIIAGGAEATLNQLAVAGFTNCKALSEATDPNAASLPFDARRAGFVMGEGAGVLILEEMEHALQRDAKIYAEITGYGNTCDAHHVTAPHPEGLGASRAMKQALKESNYRIGERLYINAHGTGTPLNDSAETKAIKIVLGQDAAHGARISSSKSMTGHMLGAAGGVEAIASALALVKGIVPPTIHLDQPDPECNLNYTPNHAEPYQADIAFSNSFGFGGHNGVIAMRRYSA